MKKSRNKNYPAQSNANHSHASQHNNHYHSNIQYNQKNQRVLGEYDYDYQSTSRTIDHQNNQKKCANSNSHYKKQVQNNAYGKNNDQSYRDQISNNYQQKVSRYSLQSGAKQRQNANNHYSIQNDVDPRYLNQQIFETSQNNNGYNPQLAQSNDCLFDYDNSIHRPSFNSISFLQHNKVNNNQQYAPFTHNFQTDFQRNQYDHYSEQTNQRNINNTSIQSNQFNDYCQNNQSQHLYSANDKLEQNLYTTQNCQPLIGNKANLSINKQQNKFQGQMTFTQQNYGNNQYYDSFDNQSKQNQSMQEAHSINSMLDQNNWPQMIPISAQAQQYQNLQNQHHDSFSSRYKDSNNTQFANNRVGQQIHEEIQNNYSLKSQQNQSKFLKDQYSNTKTYDLYQTTNEKQFNNNHYPQNGNQQQYRAIQAAQFTENQMVSDNERLRESVFSNHKRQDKYYQNKNSNMNQKIGSKHVQHSEGNLNNQSGHNPQQNSSKKSTYKNKFDKRSQGCALNQSVNQTNHECYNHGKRNGQDCNQFKGEVRRSYICQVCKQALQEVEKDFYPCNCKYQICFKCYQMQVDQRERKCPNCFKHYDSQRVEEYKQTRINRANKSSNIQNPQTNSNSRLLLPNNKYQKQIEKKDIQLSSSKVKVQPQYQVKQSQNKDKIHLQPKDQTHQIIQEYDHKDQEKQPDLKDQTETKLSLQKINDSENKDISSKKNLISCDQKEATNNQESEIQEFDNENIDCLEDATKNEQKLSKVEAKQDEKNEKRDIDVSQVLKESVETEIISPLLQIDTQNIIKNKTDDNIPNTTQKLIENLESNKANVNIEKGSQEQLQHTVQQKYDLVSKNNADQEQFELEQNLKNFKFQQINGAEQEDSDILERMSLRSSQTQNVQNNNLMTYQSQQNTQNNVRRTNSQENKMTQNRFLNHMSSQSGFSISGYNCLSSSHKENTTQMINQCQNYGGVLQNKQFKGIKLSKIRIIEKTTVYVIGLSPLLADKSLMPNYEYFGQYGQIKKIMIRNKENSSEHSGFIQPSNNIQNVKSNIMDNTSQKALVTGAQSLQCSESVSSSKSQLSFAAHITYSTPEDASLAILALDKFNFDGRKIRASYGRTKFCKYFLQHSICPDKKNCPYLHKDCKEDEILTPDDMTRKEELFSQCQKLAIQVSKIAQMTESQYRNLLQHKRELLCHRNNHKHLLPKVESIFENKDLLKNISIYRKNILKAQRINQLKIGSTQQSQSSIPLISQKSSEQKTNQNIKQNLKAECLKEQDQSFQSVKQSNSIRLDQKVQNLSLVKQFDDLLCGQTTSSVIEHVCYQNTRKSNLARSGSQRQPVERSDDKQNKKIESLQLQDKSANIQGQGTNEQIKVSKSKRRNSYQKVTNISKQLNSSQLIEIQLKDVKIQRQSTQNINIWPNSQIKVSPKMQDLVTSKQNGLETIEQKNKNIDSKIKDFIDKRNNQQLSAGLNKLKINAQQQSLNDQSESIDKCKKSTCNFDQPNTYNSVFSDQAKFVDNSNLDKENFDHIINCQNQSILQRQIANQSIQENKIDEINENKLADQNSKNIGGQRRRLETRDRKKSVSKSIQRSLRQNSMSSHVEFTLKYVLNDDMAICNINQKYNQEPLIENHNEDSELDRNSLINKMINQNQKLYCLGANDKDQFDVKSSFQSNIETKMGPLNAANTKMNEQMGIDSNSYQRSSDFNLQKINNIYTSPFFLINTQSNKKTDDTRESIQKIWDDFDYLEGQSILNVNSQTKQMKTNFESHSVNNQNLQINQYSCIQTKFGNDEGSFQRESNKLTSGNFNCHMVKYIDQSKLQQSKNPNSSHISSTATESQTKTHKSLKGQPFYSNNQLQSTMSGFQTNIALKSNHIIPNNQLMQSNQLKVGTDYFQSTQFNHNRQESGKLYSEGQQTPAKRIQNSGKIKQELINRGRTDDIIDQSQHWNQIFLQDEFNQHNNHKNRSQVNLTDLQNQTIKSNVSQKNVLGELKMKKLTSNIITSRSVFSFPILDDVFMEPESNDQAISNQKNRKGRAKNDDSKDKTKNDRRRSHESGTRREFQTNSFTFMNSQKRKSLCDAFIASNSNQFLLQNNKIESQIKKADNQTAHVDTIQLQTNLSNQNYSQNQNDLNQKYESNGSLQKNRQFERENCQLKQTNKFTSMNKNKMKKQLTNCNFADLEKSIDNEQKTQESKQIKYKGTTSAYDEFIKVNDLFS